MQAGDEKLISTEYGPKQCPGNYKHTNCMHVKKIYTITVSQSRAHYRLSPHASLSLASISS